MIGEKDKRVSRAAHAFGAATGLLLGVFILKNRVKSDGEGKFKIGAFVLFVIMVVIFVIWHLAGDSMEDDSWFNPKNDANTNITCKHQLKKKLMLLFRLALSMI